MIGFELDLFNAIVGLYRFFPIILLNVLGKGYGHTLMVSGASIS